MSDTITCEVCGQRHDRLFACDARTIQFLTIERQRLIRELSAAITNSNQILAENAKLLALLARERNQFGKRETELMSENQRLKNQLLDLSGETHCCMQCESYAKEIERLKALDDNDRKELFKYAEFRKVRAELDRLKERERGLVAALKKIVKDGHCSGCENYNDESPSGIAKKALEQGEPK